MSTTSNNLKKQIKLNVKLDKKIMADSNTSSIVGGLTNIFTSEVIPINELNESIKKFKNPISRVLKSRNLKTLKEQQSSLKNKFALETKERLENQVLNPNPPCLEVHKRKYKEFNEKLNKVDIIDEAD
jgi:hypothetical protein